MASALPMGRDAEAHCKEVSTALSSLRSSCPCREPLVIACVSKLFHREVGKSRELDLLGQWFWRERGAKCVWAPYSFEANWDLEVAHSRGDRELTVQICEA